MGRVVKFSLKAPNSDSDLVDRVSKVSSKHVHHGCAEQLRF